MDRVVCEHFTPLSLPCDKCQLSPIDRLGIAISNAGITWTDDMRQAWDDAKNEHEARAHKVPNVQIEGQPRSGLPLSDVGLGEC